MQKWKWSGDAIGPLPIEFLSFNLTARGDTACQLVEMEQILEHDHSMQKNFSERIANVQREKSNKCNLCDYASSHAGHLRTHMKMHSGEKLNKCNLCDFASIQAGNLRTHLKTHSGEKSNKCSQCDYASSYASALKTHLKIHSGEKPNKCNQCDYASSESGDVRKVQSGEKRNKCS